MSIFKLCKSFFSVNWIITLIINFKYLPLNQACRLPIFVYRLSNCSGKGKILILSNTIVPGMIKLGIKHEPSCMSLQGIHIINNGTIIFNGSGIIGNGSSLVVNRNSILEFGKNFGITGNLSVHCSSRIIIGDNLSCSWNVSISDTDHHQCINPDTCIQYPITKPVTIGNNVWCCQHSIISKGSNIPDWVTIAQMSLTNRIYEVPYYSILAGIPAKEINKKIKREDIEIIQKLSPNWFITYGLKIFNQR